MRWCCGLTPNSRSDSVPRARRGSRPRRMSRQRTGPRPSSTCGVACFAWRFNANVVVRLRRVLHVSVRVVDLWRTKDCTCAMACREPIALQCASPGRASSPDAAELLQGRISITRHVEQHRSLNVSIECVPVLSDGSRGAPQVNLYAIGCSDSGT
jgi:hypothetical protein